MPYRRDQAVLIEIAEIQRKISLQASSTLVTMQAPPQAQRLKVFPHEYRRDDT
jgi:hypothetical protein